MADTKGNPNAVAPATVSQQLQFEAPQSQLLLPIRFVGEFLVTDTTPSVLNVERWVAKNTGAVSVIAFDDGQEGQEIKILGDGHTTITNNALIKTNTGANKLLAVNKVYTFTLFLGVWVENA